MCKAFVKIEPFNCTCLKCVQFTWIQAANPIELKAAMESGFVKDSPILRTEVLPFQEMGGAAFCSRILRRFFFILASN